jgi:hypothetical protein
MEKQNSIAQDRFASHVDAVGHDSVQPWSAGPLFPCVIARVERYAEYTPFAEFRRWQDIYGWSDAETLHNYEGCRATWYELRPLSERLRSVSHELIAYGRREEYATREDAEMVARALNESERLRTRWTERSESRMDAAVLGTIVGGAPCGCYPAGNDGDCPAPGCNGVRPHDQAGVS